MANKPYRDKEWLHKQYHEKEKTLSEIANGCGVSHTTIGDWMDKHDIERRSQKQAQKTKGKYTNKEWLQEQYIGKERSLHDIAAECDVTGATILKWARRFDIDTREYGEFHKEAKASFVITERGYTRVQAKVNGVSKYAYVHQLLAIANGADPHKVFSGDYAVHHKNELKWDNRPENVEFVSVEEHAAMHTKERGRTPTGEWE